MNTIATNETITPNYPVSEMVSEHLHKYVPTDLKNEKGLFLFTPPTGSGKTYNIAKHCSERAQQGFKSFYITTLHINLDDFRKNVEFHCAALGFTPKILKIEDRLKHFQSIAQDLQAKKFTFLSELKYFNDFKKKVLWASKYMNDLQRDTIETEIKSHEQSFRNEAREYFSKLDKESRTEFMKEISYLYPAANIQEYDIVLMTIDRFLKPVWHPEKTFNLFDGPIIKNTLLYMDEFDASKEKMLAHFTGEAERYVTDLISLFWQIKANITSKTFFAKYNIHADVEESISEAFERVFEKYNMEFTFNLKDDSFSRTLLQSSHFPVLSAGETKKLGIETDRANATNLIVEDKDNLFGKFLKEIDQCLKRFIGAAASGVQNMNRKQSEKTLNKDELETIDEIAENLVRELDMKNDSRHRYLVDSIIKSSIGTSLATQRFYETSKDGLYENGFQIIDIIKPKSTSKRSDFAFYSLRQTPESFLKYLGKTTFIVGASATANFKTTLTNFDLSYISEFLIVKAITNQEAKDLSQLYAKSMKHRDLEIHSIRDVTKDSIPQFLKKIGMTSDLAMLAMLIDEVKKMDDFEFYRLCKIVTAYSYFLKNEKAKSFLCFIPKKINTDANFYSIFKKMAAELNRIYGDPMNAKNDENNLFFALDGSTKDEYDSKILKELEAGEKRFITTTYKTLGAGVNMQYQDNVSGKKKDFDGIYIEAPTSLIPHKKRDIPMAIPEKLSAIYKISSMYENGEFSRDELKILVRHFMSNGKTNLRGLKYTNNADYRNAAASAIVQAIGRLYRENTNDYMLLCYDYNAWKYFAELSDDSHTMVPATTALISDVRKNSPIDSSNNDEKLQKLKNIVFKNNASVHKAIRYYKQAFNDAKDIRSIEFVTGLASRWQTLRESLASGAELNSRHEAYFDASGFIENGIYWYSENNDYLEIEIFLNKEDAEKASFHGKRIVEVSVSSARIDILTKLPELQTLFEDGVISDTFIPSKMMVPIAFNNLYKGAIGEIVGKHLFEMYDMPLFDLNTDDGDIFEFFDFKDKSGKLYIDFKYYSTATASEAGLQELAEKATSKKESIGAEAAMIVNVLADGDGKHGEITRIGNVFFVPFLINENGGSPVLNRNAINTARSIYESFNNSHEYTN